MSKINITTDDIAKILDNIGSMEEIDTVDGLMQFIEDGIANKSLIGKDLKDIAQSIVQIAKEQDVVVELKELYNPKEKIQSTIKCFERIKKFLFEEEDQEPTTEPTQNAPQPEAQPQPQPSVQSVLPQKPNDNVNFQLPSLDELENLYNSIILPTGVVSDDSLDVYGKMLYVPNNNIRFEDKFIIFGVDDTKYTTQIVAIVNASNNVIAVGRLKSGTEGYHIVCNVDNISNYWGGSKLFNIVLFPKSFEDYFSKKSSQITDQVTTLRCSIDKKELELSNAPLCIDFGTSNTTAGIYVPNPENDGCDVKLVEFLDVTKSEEKYSYMLPTVAYVKDCSNPHAIKYLFGYEAKKKIQELDYNTEADVFYEIKRWISSEECEEEVMDEEWNSAQVTHIDIINAYLKHVVTLAERYFQCKFKELHFTAPVKLKSKFYQIVKQCFNNTEYVILDENQTIDEGIATIYESICNTLNVMSSVHNENGELYEKTEERSIMVLDCGGGTTDVATCKFQVKRDQSNDFYHLDIVTKFVNGNSNFGGNNITYRIMQLLKIKLAHSYKQNLAIPSSDKIYTRIGELIPYDAIEILNHIDDEDIDIYATLEKEYQKAENIIPTLFAEVKLRKKKSQYKRNFFYLWQLAEKIKVEFYKRNDLLSIGFTNNDDQFRENILKQDDTHFYLYINDGVSKELRQSNDIPQIEINTKEIDTLIYADIYALIHRIFAKSCDVDKYNFYKLSGQSCKIALFNTLLKELVPGNKLRKSSTKYNRNGIESTELKMSCINGSVKYMYHTKMGNIKPHIVYANEPLLYKIQRKNGNAFEDIMTQDSVKVCTLPANTESVQIRMVDIYSNKAEPVKYINICKDVNPHKKYSTQKLFEFLNRTTSVDQSIIASIVEQLKNVWVKDGSQNDKLYFTLPSKDSFSFYNYVIQKSINASDNSQEYTLISYTVCPFEANLSTTTFFNGKR